MSAHRIDGGWALFDQYLREVVELDDDLREMGQWGRRGEGPGEYTFPAGLGKIMMGQAVIVDNLPASVITVDGETTTEYRLEGDVDRGMIQDVVFLEQGRRIIFAQSTGVREAAVGEREIFLKWSNDDLGIVDSGEGIHPEFRLRPVPTVVCTLRRRYPPRFGPLTINLVLERSWNVAFPTCGGLHMRRR